MGEDVTVSGEALEKAKEYVEIEEGVVNKLPGVPGLFVTALAVIMSLFHLYAAYGIMPTHILRGIHVAFILFLCFLLCIINKSSFLLFICYDSCFFFYVFLHILHI